MTTTCEAVRELVENAMGGEGDTLPEDPEAPLLGAVPAFDSIAIVCVLSMLEEQYKVDLNDADVDATTFQSIASITSFINRLI